MTAPVRHEQQDELIVLFLAANPSTTARLAIEQELHKIQTQLYRFASRTLKLIPATAVKPLEVHRLILSYRPHVLHFSGHGTQQRGILMLDETGVERAVTPQALASVIRVLSGSIQCVVLNACYTSEQAKVLAQCVPYVIGMPGAIADQAAIAFSVGFYDALSADYPIEDAFQLGCATLAVECGDSGFRGSALGESGVPTEPTTGFRSGARDFSAASSGADPPLAPILITSDDPSLQPERRAPEVEPPSRAVSSELRHQLEDASRATRNRLQDKLPQIADGKGPPLIVRTDTAPDISRFLSGSEPIMVIVGDSGAGKSTLLYQLATGQAAPDVEILPLLYDIHQIKAADSLLNRLTFDLGVPGSSLLDYLRSAVGSLRDEGIVPVLLVDGINEAETALAETIKVTVEDLGAKLGGDLKIVITCRSVFWDTYFSSGSTPADTYFGGSVQWLRGFSLQEARHALAVYAGRFHFRGTFDDMSLELQERVRDPLMLRMLAEGYSDRDLPDFAPAVAIFTRYEQQLRKKFASESVMSCLERMLAAKADAFLNGDAPSDFFRLHEILGDPIYVALSGQTRSATPPHLVLEDEGVLVSVEGPETVLRFSYERFYEFLLGRLLVRQWERREGAGLDPVALLEQALETHYTFAQALKSELIRRIVLESKPDRFTDLLRPTTMAALLEGPCRMFAKEVLRELMFDSDLDIPQLVAGALGDGTDSRLLLVELAPESPEVSSTLIDCLFSADRELMLRMIQLLPNFLRRRHIRQGMDQEFLDRFFIFSPSEARALVFYLASVFVVEQQTGRSPGAACGALLREVLARTCLEREQFVAVLAPVLAEVVREEGPKFYGLGFTEGELEYPWKAMGQQERELALRVNALIADCTLLERPALQEAAIFFGAGVSRWSDFQAKKPCKRNDYQLENRITQWALMRYSQNSFGDFVALLDRFVEYGTWLTIDFALCAMDYALHVYHGHDRALVRQGYELMLRWDRQYRELPEYFYALTCDEPFDVNSVPLVMAAGVEARFFTPDDAAIPLLRERLLAGGRDTHLALLTARWLWHEFPRRILATLESVLFREEPQIVAWVNRILTEIYLVYPRLVEDLLWRNQVEVSRSRHIKHEHTMRHSTNVMYDGTELYKFLFHPERSARVARWHRRIYEVRDLDTYCLELVRFLLADCLSDAVLAEEEVH